MGNVDNIETLNRDDAIKLWKKGKEKWNKWVEDNQKHNIDFSAINFHDHLKTGVMNIDFREFVFPSGKISFDRVQFGDAHVYFDNARFSEGNVYFRGTQFGEGLVSFKNAEFGKSDVDFRRTRFGKGDVHFDNAKFDGGHVSFYHAEFDMGHVHFHGTRFGKGNLSFNNAQVKEGNVSFQSAKFGEGHASFNNARFSKGHAYFDDAQFGESYVSFNSTRFGNGYDVSFERTEFGKGNVYFDKARFGKGNASFNNARLGEADVSFRSAHFGKGNASFDHAQFGKGNVHFDKTRFGKGDASFDNAQFGKGNTSFDHAQFGKGKITFINATIEGTLVFASCKLFRCKQLSFRSCNFKGAASIENIKSPVTIDLRYTNHDRSIDFHNVEIGFDQKLHSSYALYKATNHQDSPCFRRLKKLAKEADNHSAALDFFAKEMRSNYWHGLRGPKLFLYYLYDWLSDYGRSVRRPFFGLLIACALLTPVYWSLSTEENASFKSAFILSLNNSIPFHMAIKDVRQDAIDALYCSMVSIPLGVQLLTMLHISISTAFIFLIALALRNLYRS